VDFATWESLRHINERYNIITQTDAYAALNVPRPDTSIPPRHRHLKALMAKTRGGR
jgi:hypothetical protein